MSETHETRTQALLFGGVAGFMFLITAIYWFTSYEDAGGVMLLLSGAFAGAIAVHLWLQSRHQVEREEAPTTPAAEPTEPYQPHSSVWPLAIGVAAFLCASGLVLGGLFLVPGAIALALAVTGWATQTRRRS